MTPAERAELERWLVHDPKEWPRCLSDEDLEAEYFKVMEDATHLPISIRMLRAERERRKKP